MKSKSLRLLIFVVLLVAVALGFRQLRTSMTQSRVVSPDTHVVAETYYTLCQHKVSRQVAVPREQKMTVSQLESTILGGDDWSPKFEGSNLMLRRTSEGLCPSCQKKTHLGNRGGFVTVIQGPPGVEGKVLRVTKIRVGSLPARLKTQVEQGKMNLPDEKSLLQVLDSLTENNS